MWSIQENRIIYKQIKLIMIFGTYPVAEELQILFLKSYTYFVKDLWIFLKKIVILGLSQDQEPSFHPFEADWGLGVVLIQLFYQIPCLLIF